MGYSNSAWGIIFRVGLMAAFIVSAVVSFYETDYVVTPLMFSFLSGVVATELIWHLRKNERLLARFLLSIKHHDFSRNYKTPAASSGLFEAFDLITKSFEQLETQKHADYRLLQTVSEHIKIGLAYYDPEGQVLFSNKAFKEMLKLRSFARIDTLKSQHPAIHKSMTTNEQMPEVLIESSGPGRFLLKTEAFTLQGQQYRLASLYDIRSTLDGNELASYQKLMRVMTHEVMNSATPVLSLIRIVNQKLIRDDKLVPLPEADQKNIAFSLKAIETRTASILKFVEAYRKINKEIKPDRRPVSVKDLIGPIILLMAPPAGVSLTFTNEADRTIFVDTELMSQTLINLLKNALEAVANVADPAVEVRATMEDGKLCITVQDNGEGIPEASQKDIFVPFFTTKPDGSGVGLALSRKIVHAHGGSLTYRSTEEGITCFKILLPEETIIKGE